jgi:hypothetical protein
LRRIREDPPRPPGRLAPWLPPGAARAIEAGLEKRPEDRPDEPEELAAELEELA